MSKDDKKKFHPSPEQIWEWMKKQNPKTKDDILNDQLDYEKETVSLKNLKIEKEIKKVESQILEWETLKKECEIKIVYESSYLNRQVLEQKKKDCINEITFLNQRIENLKQNFIKKTKKTYSEILHELNNSYSILNYHGKKESEELLSNKDNSWLDKEAMKNYGIAFWISNYEILWNVCYAIGKKSDYLWTSKKLIKRNCIYKYKVDISESTIRDSFNELKKIGIKMVRNPNGKKNAKWAEWVLTWPNVSSWKNKIKNFFWNIQKNIKDKYKTKKIKIRMYQKLMEFFSQLNHHLKKLKEKKLSFTTKKWVGLPYDYLEKIVNWKSKSEHYKLLRKQSSYGVDEEVDLIDLDDWNNED